MGTLYILLFRNLLRIITIGIQPFRFIYVGIQWFNNRLDIRKCDNILPPEKFAFSVILVAECIVEIYAAIQTDSDKIPPPTVAFSLE